VGVGRRASCCRAPKNSQTITSQRPPRSLRPQSGVHCYAARALLTVDRKVIFSDVVEHMPRNRCLLGLSPLEEVDASLSNRLDDLHSRRGLRLLFLGYSRRDPREQLLDLADIVEIDAFGLSEDARSLLIRRGQRRKLQVLAESVERDIDFVQIRDSGFELFSGKSYSEASEDEDTQATGDGKVLLQLLVEARGELEIEQVSQGIRETPVLEEGLLRIVNSLELARAQKIDNVGQALIMIGERRRFWLGSSPSFTSCSGSIGRPRSPT
jgi:c-di-GMP-related signal transduction protein